MVIIGIESSCDETAVAIVRDGREILSSVIASQTDLHAKFGGVVPEIASRAHVEAISGLCYEAIRLAGISIDEIDAVAATEKPGLIGALLVGLSFARGFALRFGKPFIAVNHIHAHLAAAHVENPELSPPYLGFVASGGHTSIILVENYSSFATIGSTRDDAVGETFDKIARRMGLSYPGGAKIESLAANGNAGKIKMPAPKVAGSDLDFSFSGLKTFVVNFINKIEQKGSLDDETRADIAASLTENVTRAITSRLRLAIEETGQTALVCAGGVMANGFIRAGIAHFSR